MIGTESGGNLFCQFDVHEPTVASSHDTQPDLR
jgi:hypothetical protein